jgi:hypothetical protein
MRLVHQQETELLANYFGKVFQALNLRKDLILCFQTEIVILILQLRTGEWIIYVFFMKIQSEIYLFTLIKKNDIKCS